MTEKFTQPTAGRAVFAAALARLMGQPRFDRDEATAKILRTALAQAASWRGTDRLIRIVVD